MNTFYKTLAILNTFFLLALTVYIFVRQPQQIVYVNSSKLVGDYKGMQVAREAYKSKAAVWKANVDTLVNEVRGEIMNYEKESRSMTVKERQLSKELIQTKQNQLAQYQQAMNTKAQEEDGKMTNEVLITINNYIKEYGRQHGYQIIIAATEYGNVAYADEGLDITNDVLNGLNDNYNGN